MKKIIFILLSMLAITIALSSCQKETVQTTSSSQISVQLPDWVIEKQKEVVTLSNADLQLASIDFDQPVTDDQINTLASDIVHNMQAAGRQIPIDVCKKIASKSYSDEELQQVRSTYFYSDSNRDAESIKTRTVMNGVQYDYSTFGIYFYIITHLNTVCPNGTNEAINYFTAGSSANRLTFADANRAGRALNNQYTVDLLDFDPNLADFHYYDGTGDPVIYSTWAYEMVYEDDITLNDVVYPGPFGSQDGSNFNFPFMFATPFNEQFIDVGEDMQPLFPLYDALWYIPIQGLGAVYVLNQDL